MTLENIMGAVNSGNELLLARVTLNKTLAALLKATDGDAYCEYDEIIQRARAEIAKSDLGPVQS